MTGLDILVLALMGGAAALGFSRGFVTEALSLGAWVFAIAVVKTFHAPVAAALISAWSERPVPIDTIAFGEVALSGEIRPVSHAGLRLKEAAKLGFEKAFVPAGSGLESVALQAQTFRTLGQFVDHLLSRG